MSTGIEVPKALDAIPLVQSTADRTTRFPTPADNQRVQNLGTHAFERYSAASGGWVQDLGRSALDPVAYGVVGNGVTDDTAAWKAVIAAAKADGTRVVRMPRMVSVISDQLDCSSVTLLGEGPNASQFLLAAGFTAASALLKSGDGVTGEGRNILRGFSINGNRAAQTVASHGVIIEGNCLYGVVENIEVLGMHGKGVVIRTSGGLHPSLMTFREVNVTDCDGDGWEVRSGQNLTFLNCSGENVGGIGLNISGADEYVFNCTWIAPWIENVGQGKDGVVVDRSRNLLFVAPQVSGYGTTPATTGHGFNVTSPTSPSQGIVIDAPNITGRAASASGSRQIYFGSATRCEVRRAPSGMLAADIDIANAGDTLILGSYDATFASNELRFLTNLNATLTASSTAYLSPAGFLDATQTNAQHTVYGAMAVVGLSVSTNTSPGAGSAVFTLVKNGTPTSLTVTLTAATYAAGVSSATAVNFAPGDTFSLKAVGGASDIAIGGIKATLAVRR